MFLNLLDNDNIDLKDKILDIINNLDPHKILEKLKQVDGSGSGLDADLLDGHDSTYFAKNDLSNVSDNDFKNKYNSAIGNGSGSGLDADTLDGHDSSYFAKNDLSNVPNSNILNKLKQVDGSGSGLDADLLDGLDSSAFLRRDKSSYPTQNNSFDLGSSSHKWKNIHANTFKGNSIEVENADLAEQYICKDELEIGDVVVISNDPSFEIEKSNEIASHKVVGVFSDNPALKMNDIKITNGKFIALKGKVKVKVKGIVNKGDPLVSYKNGYAISIFNEDLLSIKNKNTYNIPSFCVLGKALENSINEEGLIDVIIGL